MGEAVDRAPEDLRVGLTAEYGRELTEADVLAFGTVTGDTNPLHVDSGYASETRIGARIVHGALQVGLASALAGMHLPGRRCLLTSTHARFPAPLFFPARVTVRGHITAWNPATASGQLRAAVIDETRAVTTADVTIGFALHAGTRSVMAQPRAAQVAAADQRLLVITGASGGIGSALVESLADRFDVIAVAHTRSLAESLASLPHVSEVRLDLSDRGWPDALSAVVADRSLFGVIHAAWPGMPRGGLLDAPPETIQRQLDFAAVETISLARMLFASVPASGGRMIALGSIAGTRKPAVGVAAYSLGKSLLEHTVQMLAPELARKRVTINAICPTFVPTGMNRQSDDRTRLLEAAKIPIGRLCEPRDVVALARYLLSPDAEFLSGQSIALSGGQL